DADTLILQKYMCCGYSILVGVEVHAMGETFRGDRHIDGAFSSDCRYNKCGSPAPVRGHGYVITGFSRSLNRLPGVFHAHLFEAHPSCPERDCWIWLFLRGKRPRRPACGSIETPERVSLGRHQGQAAGTDLAPLRRRVSRGYVAAARRADARQLVP